MNRSSRVYHTNPTTHSLWRQILAELSTDSTTVAMWSCDLAPDDTQMARLLMARTCRLPEQSIKTVQCEIKTLTR